MPGDCTALLLIDKSENTNYFKTGIQYIAIGQYSNKFTFKQNAYFYMLDK